MVSHLVENEVLCNTQKIINPASWINPNNCNTMESVRLQALRIRELQDYIDAQAGGPGKGFFRIVHSPAEARQVISQDKLAVVMGMEVSELFNCGLNDKSCSKADVDNHLNFVHSLGVRVLYPVHRFDNQFGGTRIEDGFINVGQALSSGRFFETRECPADIDGVPMTNGFPLIGQVPVLKQILKGLGLQPNYDESYKHCNQHNLTDLGVYLVNRMVDRGMMIELDHMSYETASSVLKVAEGRQYSGVITGHSHLSKAPGGYPSTLHDRIARLGGIMSTYNSNASAVSYEVDKMISLANQYPYLIGVGISTDINGLAQQAAARPDMDKRPLLYPFTSFDGRYEFQPQKTGNRVFDYNQNGVAHYGLLADHIEDIRTAGTASAYDSIMNSVEAYLQMWERSLGNNSNNYADPFAQEFFSLKDQRSGKCLDIPGDDNQVHRNSNVQLWDCQDSALDQQWKYNQATGKLHNRANPSFCLDNEGDRHDGGTLKLWECVDTSNQTFDMSDGMIHPRNSAGFVVDANGTHNGANATLWSAHRGSNQLWTKQYLR
ncbi:MAG: ricin-type beta-trefoil lectin domain protein [Endozoicomonas sp.]|uniref:ricin-type beta-trefoil lectin domain protein n=1 Tax=Endozoicomonas sp. TaxID=1892382 RepID=UPI003D9BCEA6